MDELALLREAMTDKGFQQFLKEALDSVEDELAQEDRNWINLSQATGVTIQDAARIEAVKQSRLYYYTDPMAKQAIRLWTDYTFGEGMTWQAEEDDVREVMEAFWDAPENQVILGSRGQRKSSDRLLVDGEIFFALFLGAGEQPTTIRTIDTLEITEIITDPNDIETPLYYKRDWVDRQSKSHTDYYRSTVNQADKTAPDSLGKSITKTQDALVYHLTQNTLSQRGIPLLLPSHFWLKYQRKFLAARISIMLALTRFAWKAKVQGGSTAVATVKTALDGQTPAAGSALVENMAVDTQPIKTETGATNAYQDGRMIRLQVCSAVGWPEQYFGDLSTGNLATAKTVELPVQKMCSSYQKVWADAYQDICEVVLEHNEVPAEDWFVDLDFPPIAPADNVSQAQTMQAISTVMPSLADSREVKMAALVAMGINNPGEVLDELTKKKAADKAKATPAPQSPPGVPGDKPGATQPPAGAAQPPEEPEATTAKLINALHDYKVAIEAGGNGNDADKAR